MIKQTNLFHGSIDLIDPQTGGVVKTFDVREQKKPTWNHRDYLLAFVSTLDDLDDVYPWIEILKRAEKFCNANGLKHLTEGWPGDIIK